jgi:predicted hotdog family 3-hydroxylacyl-ACP dehydratase
VAETVCAVDPVRSDLFARADGSVPAWVGLEYMAQCVAVHGGLAARAQGTAASGGILLGSRRMRFDARDFVPGDELLVRARHHAGESGLVAFDCSLSRNPGDAPLIAGRLNVYRFEDWREIRIQEVADD